MNLITALAAIQELALELEEIPSISMSVVIPLRGIQESMTETTRKRFVTFWCNSRGQESKHTPVHIIFFSSNNFNPSYFLLDLKISFFVLVFHSVRAFDLLYQKYIVKLKAIKDFH